jgi:hypothetical protein
MVSIRERNDTMGHGPGLRGIDAAQGQTMPAAQPGIDPKFFAGFSYLLGDPRPGDRSQWGDNLANTRDLFSKLIKALPGDTYSFWPKSLKEGAEPNENPFIPSGYTYLLQFVAHDMMLTSVPFWAAADVGVVSENTRATGLVLDALYGGGPIACPAAYKPVPSMDENRYLLQLGRVAPAQPGCPVRDLARVNVANGIAAAGPGVNVDSINFDGAHQVNVADARNDDTVILTQLAVLLAYAHNVIAESVASDRPEAKFAYARAAMQMIYHAIIRGDLLPRLLHPQVWNPIENRSAASSEWLWQQPGLPLEFSHGAFRVGHAMVRTGYKLNDTLTQPLPEIVGHNQPKKGADGSWRTPLETKPNWILQWSYFFEFARTPNLSLRIGPSRSSLDLPGLFAFPGPSGPNDTFTSFRDLLSAAAAKTWSIDALIRTIAARPRSLIPPGWLFADRDKPAAADRQLVRPVRQPRASPQRQRFGLRGRGAERRSTASAIRLARSRARPGRARAKHGRAWLDYRGRGALQAAGGRGCAAASAPARMPESASGADVVADHRH